MTFKERIEALRMGLKEKDDVSRSIPFLCKSMIILLIIGVAARLILGFFMTHVYDMYHWGTVIENIDSGNGLYEITGYFYTPPWGYILGIEALFQNLIGVTVIGEHLTAVFPMEDIAWYYTSTVTTVTFNISLKLIFLISDLVTGYLIFWLIRDITQDKRKSMIGFVLWFLCPFVIASGSVIGMFDTISVLMTLLAIIMLRRDRYMEAGVMLGLATLLKFFPGFLAPIFIAYIISKSRRTGTVKKNLAKFIVSIAVISFIIFLPQILDGTLADCFLFITSRLDEGVGSDIIGTIGGYAALLIYVVSLAVSIAFAVRIVRNDDRTKIDGLLFDAFLISIAVMFLYPPLPQYVLLLLPFVIFAMQSDRRYNVPCCLLMIGTTIATLAGGPTDLVAVAAYTDLLNLDSLMSIIEGYISPIFGGISGLILVGYVGFAIQYVGILSVLWVRFGNRIKGKIHIQKHAEVDDNVVQ